MTTRDERPPAMRSADTAAMAWAEAVRQQQSAPASHADFYALAAELVATLNVLDDLSVIVAGQVGRYGQGRTLYDDTRTVDPALRLGEAAEALSRVHAALGTTATAANEFWNAISHIGVEVTP